MPRAGGPRSGTPGRSYANRKDLNVIRAPQTGVQTAAAGGQVAPAPAPPQRPRVTPDMVPKLDDPSANPNEPVTAGLMQGPGAGPEAMPAMPLPREVTQLQAAYLANPTPEMRRTMAWLIGQGVL